MAMAQLPPWSRQDETKPAPMPLLLVQAFVNTLDPDAGTDLLAEPETAARWLASAGLMDADGPVDPADAELARGVREGLRALLEHGPALTPEQLRPLQAVAEAHRARLSVDPAGALGLDNPGRRDLRHGLFDLLLIVRDAQQDGDWPRLKVCANPDCRWAFYDRSRNRQGTWCEMAVCGNRLKNRSLRARRRGPA
jgi:predicted RNA-binding Zn ribbon-like protein